jgi:hypothetical protein
LILAAVLVLLRIRDAPTLLSALLAGALIALASLTRSNGAAVLVAALLALLVVCPPRRRAAMAVVLVGGFALTLVPWTMRNHSALDALRPLGTQAGYTMAGQWNVEAARPGTFQAAWRVPAEVPAFRDLHRRPGFDEADVDAELRARAVRFAADHPDHALTALRVNAVRIFEAGPGHSFVSGVAHREMGIPGRWRLVVQLSVYALVAFAIAGALLLWRRRCLGPAWFLLVPVLLLATVVPFLGSPRYRAPVDPFLLMLAAPAAIEAARRLKGSGAASGLANDVNRGTTRDRTTV